MKSIITRVAIAMGLARHHGLPVEEASPPEDPYNRGAASLKTGSGESMGKHKATVNHFGQFQPIIDALNEALHQFAVGELQGHRAINPNMGCQITLIEIRPLSEAADRPLKTLLSLHKPHAIAGLLQREILPTLTNNLVFDFSSFGGLSRQPFNASEAVRSDQDDLLAEFGRVDTVVGQYEVGFHWNPVEDFRTTAQGGSHLAGVSPQGMHQAGMGDGQSAAVSAPDTVPSSHPVQEPAIAPAEGGVPWCLEDVKGTRVVTVARRGPDAPLILGNDASLDIHVQGIYTSSQHGTLWFDKGRWWFRDIESTNGSRVVRPGQPDYIFPPKGGRGANLPALELMPGYVIVFSAVSKESDSVSDYPRLYLKTSKGKDSSTPLSPGAGNRKPVQTDADAATVQPAPLALMHVEDCQGRRDFPLRVQSLPFKVGRDADSGYAIPWEHETVSRDLMQIEKIDAEGAHIRVVGSSGVSLGGVLLNKGDEAVWPWGSELVLEDEQDGGRHCRLNLHKPHECAQGTGS